ncbi:hypothetical protein TWF173_001525 [Orbilia oligospora]|uniref:Uncharacterized protein n=2 Tax=Orbilia oligospora TaxID=2813651 RepID=G1XLR8_ARTOA|nr:hypothetical protein AOL_s00112g98 [Orbilia oligospora ATCC 24927]EGX45909.1 hypothetical protein AOL_s00112g98 [Orbilia oligospora ATCC 24927]KAF3279887.1 hypothetical protein TWF970_003907 [Orbilia oligospora]KAF3308314.1 hypothetical protein TWF173_001525 [Orbilia oligospora]
MARRVSILLVFAVASLFLAGTFIYQAPSRPSTTFGTDTNFQSATGERILAEKRPLRIAFVETGGSHDEVLAALVNSWGKLPGAELTFFQRLSRYGSHDIMRTFDLSNPIPDHRGMDDFRRADENQPVPDIVVATTCEFDMRKYQENMTVLLENHKTYLFCVIHHADRWGYEKHHLEEALTPWVRANRAEFLALSPHTAEFLLEQSLKKWKVVKEEGHQPLVRHFVPVFPVQLPPIPTDDSNLSFGLQGDFGQERRDYKMVFRRLGEFLKPASAKPLPPSSPQGPAVPAKRDESEDEESQTKIETQPRNITLHLVGHGRHPPVPAEVVNNVVFDEGLNYIDFYTILSRCFALLPAFATPEYLDRKASSTVPASLIAGTPLVATKAIISAYAYLTEEAVWLQDESETDFDVIGRVLRMSNEDRKAKSTKVRELRQQIIDENINLARKWTLEAFKKIGVRTYS